MVGKLAGRCRGRRPRRPAGGAGGCPWMPGIGQASTEGSRPLPTNEVHGCFVGNGLDRSVGCRKRCAHPLAPSVRGLRPQAVGERTVRLPEIFWAMARFSPPPLRGTSLAEGGFSTAWGPHICGPAVYGKRALMGNPWAGHARPLPRGSQKAYTNAAGLPLTPSPQTPLLPPSRRSPPFPPYRRC